MNRVEIAIETAERKLKLLFFTILIVGFSIIGVMIYLTWGFLTALPCQE